MNYIVFDNPADKEKMRFLENDFLLIFPDKKLEKYNNMYRFCKYVYKQTTKNDVVIFWYDFMAVIYHYICKLRLSKRKIIMLNILLKEKNTLKNKLAKLMYKSALKNNYLFATVTSEKYGKNICNYLKIDKDLTLIHDPYVKNTNINFSYETKNYVFCGGRNGRDWNFAIQVAKKCKNINFHFIMGNEEYVFFKDEFPANVSVLYDVSADEFEKELAQSKFVILPLSTNAPAGLLVFYQAAMHDKFIITTQTPVTEDYLGDSRGMLLVNDSEIWKKKLINLMKDENFKSKNSSFNNFLIKNASTDIYLKKLNEIAARF